MADNLEYTVFNTENEDGGVPVGVISDNLGYTVFNSEAEDYVPPIDGNASTADCILGYTVEDAKNTYVTHFECNCSHHTHLNTLLEKFILKVSRTLPPEAECPECKLKTALCKKCTCQVCPNQHLVVKYDNPFDCTGCWNHILIPIESTIFTT